MYSSRTPHRAWTAVVFVLVTVIVGLMSVQIARAAGTPTAMLAVPAETMIGQPLRFTASFDNTGSTTGYGPYLDLILPAPGADGAAAGTAYDDGLRFAG